MAGATAHVLVVITCGSDQEARTIARHLVTNRLAAGTQIIPVESVYAWGGELVEDDEWLLFCKTRRDRFSEIEEAVHRLHSYEVIPIYMIDMASIGGPYGQWIEEVTAGPSA